MSSSEFRGEERIDFSHLFSLHYVGDEVSLKILRDGAEHTIKYTLSVSNPLVPFLVNMTPNKKPSYFIVGGMVFLPLSVTFLDHCYGGGRWRHSTPSRLLSLLSEFKAHEDEEVVVHSFAARVLHGAQETNAANRDKVRM